MCDELRYRINPFSWVAEMEKEKKIIKFFFFQNSLFKEMLSGRPGDYSNYFHDYHISGPIIKSFITIGKGEGY